MKGDRKLCTAAVAQDGRAIQYASEEMKQNRDICMAAIASLRNERSIREEWIPGWLKDWGVPEAVTFDALGK